MFRQYPLTLQIEPTRRCNLKCKICMRRNLSDSDSTLSLDDFKEILKCGSFQYVGLHGWGEPLLNPHLFEMITYAESQGIYTNLTTNGTMIENNIDGVFSSGLREIAFGVYDKELFLSVLPHIGNLVDQRDRQGLKLPKIYMDITIFKGSVDHIPELLDLAAELRVDAVILHRLFNVYKVSRSAEYISMKAEKSLVAEAISQAKKKSLNLYLPQRHSLPCKVVKHCIFITAEGKATPCCFLPESYLGDAVKDGVQEIMVSKRYADFVKTMGKHPICSKCRW
ncbi:radical SAM protein [Desulfosarcina ovata subsp. sediminis]|uniref:Radical SAM protein n=1 Tax=Desulfosarcina ovata subsp. sediminis TaxID=885957 RepID=A0A5K7ZRK6_9BACT|nr:radical SAM protein [Desulfosarcina ovata]BBO81953.1 radical SAM protein [Desulfosarcina ovata subsp. sediminis]